MAIMDHSVWVWSWRISAISIAATVFALTTISTAHHAEFFPLDLLRRIIGEARTAANITRVSFTGGEPTLHPAFAETLQVGRRSRIDCQLCYKRLALRSYLARDPGKSRFSVSRCVQSRRRNTRKSRSLARQRIFRSPRAGVLSLLTCRNCRLESRS